MSNGNLLLVHFGDSMAFGMTDMPAPGVLYGYNVRLANHAEADLGRKVDVVPLSMGGFTTQNILDTMGQSDALDHIRSADIITWDGGGNDWREARASYHQKNCGGYNGQTCLNAMLAEFKQNWNQIGALIQANHKPGARIFCMCYFQTYVLEDKVSNTYPSDIGKDHLVMRQYIDQMNEHAIQVAQAIPAEFLDLRPKFSPKDAFGNITDPRTLGLCGNGDPLHPTVEGHKYIAATLRARGWGELTA